MRIGPTGTQSTWPLSKPGRRYRNNSTVEVRYGEILEIP
jgi:hypothetical protein